MPNPSITLTNGSVARQLSSSQNNTLLTQAAPATNFNPFGVKDSTSTMQLERTMTTLSEQPPATQPRRDNDLQETQLASQGLVRQDAFVNN